MKHKFFLENTNLPNKPLVKFSKIKEDSIQLGMKKGQGQQISRKYGKS